MTAAQWGAPSYTAIRRPMTKAEIRRQMRTKRRSLTASQRRQASQRLLHSLRHSPRFQFSRRVAVYLTNDSEIDTAVFIRDLQKRGKQLFLPVLHPLRKGHLSFLPYRRNTPMQTNRFGIAEPDFRRWRAVPARYLDLVCMPLVAFDNAGNRLGMGGGFYDRTLAFMHRPGNKPALIGCAFECQQTESLPAEPWDIPLSAIATEQQLHLFR